MSDIGYMKGRATEVWKRDKGRCRVCDRRVYHKANVEWAKEVRYYVGMYMGHLHHINKNRKDNALLNLILFCPQCHKSVHAIEDGVQYVCMMESICEQKLLELHTWARHYNKEYERLCEIYHCGYTDECKDLCDYQKEEWAEYEGGIENKKEDI